MLEAEAPVDVTCRYRLVWDQGVAKAQARERLSRGPIQGYGYGTGSSSKVLVARMEFSFVNVHAV